MSGLFNRLIERSDDRLSGNEFVHPRVPARFERPVSSSLAENHVKENLESINEEAVTTERTSMSYQNYPAESVVSQPANTGESKRPIKNTQVNIFKPVTAISLNSPLVADKKPDVMNQFNSPYANESVKIKDHGQVDTELLSISKNSVEVIKNEPIYKTQSAVNNRGIEVDKTSGVTRRSKPIAETSERETPLIKMPVEVERNFNRYEMESVFTPAVEALEQTNLSQQQVPSVSVKIGRIDVRAAPVPAQTHPHSLTRQTAATQNPRSGSSVTRYLGWRRK